MKTLFPDPQFGRKNRKIFFMKRLLENIISLPFQTDDKL